MRRRRGLEGVEMGLWIIVGFCYGVAFALQGLRQGFWRPGSAPLGGMTRPRSSMIGLVCTVATILSTSPSAG